MPNRIGATVNAIRSSVKACAAGSRRSVARSGSGIGRKTAGSVLMVESSFRRLDCPLSGGAGKFLTSAGKNFAAAGANPDMPRPALRAIPGIDPSAAERAAADLLAALGADLSDESLRDTPRRMAAAYAEMLTP